MQLDISLTCCIVADKHVERQPKELLMTLYNYSGRLVNLKLFPIGCTKLYHCTRVL